MHIQQLSACVVSFSEDTFKQGTLKFKLWISALSENSKVKKLKRVFLHCFELNDEKKMLSSHYDGGDDAGCYEGWQIYHD